MERYFINGIDDTGQPINLACRDGIITQLSQTPFAANRNGLSYDLDGKLVIAGFVDGHIHLDKSFFGDKWHPHQAADSLATRLAIEKQALASALPIEQRADALIRQVLRWGTIALRSHVDVDNQIGLSHLQAILAAKEKWRDWLDMEIVAFPQAGVMSAPGTAQLLDAAIREGANVIGGIDPSSFDGDAEGQLNVIFGLAEHHGVKIDIHLHESGRQGIDQLLRIAERTCALGLQGRVTVSHAYCLGEVASDIVDNTALALAKADIAIMTNAPGAQRFPPIWQLHHAGVRIFTGNDNIQDAWWPYGNGDMLQRAMLVGYRSGFYHDQALLLALRMASQYAAQVLGKTDYGLTLGHPATFVVINAENAAQAVAMAPVERCLVIKGEIYQPSMPEVWTLSPITS